MIWNKNKICKRGILYIEMAKIAVEIGKYLKIKP